jgi:hypothetical protein
MIVKFPNYFPIFSNILYWLSVSQLLFWIMGKQWFPISGLQQSPKFTNILLSFFFLNAHFPKYFLETMGLTMVNSH